MSTVEDGEIRADSTEQQTMNAPFEGPEKLLEIWFQAPDGDASGQQRPGLRAVSREKWEEMLDIVRCKVLSVIQGKEMDAYLLSESSLFIYPYKLILKTCGTTLNLLGLPRILEIADQECKLTTVTKCFYSRKSFMFPERQSGPHRDWKEEVAFLEKQFPGGAAYTVGKMNGDHWLLWFIDNTTSINDSTPSTPFHAFTPFPTTPPDSNADSESEEPLDYTLEILMSNLSSNSRDNFFFPPLDATENDEDKPVPTPHERALALSEKLGISSIFPPSMSQLDAYAFDPCGYSGNAVISPKNPQMGEGYWTIHVTPEEGWSYASFECNVPSSASPEDLSHLPSSFPSLLTLIQRVVDIFQPGNLSVTLFVSNNPPSHNSPIETAQSTFQKALHSRGYKRTDKITYEFAGYDLAFASFKL
ncbi:S-adenosylmethionine decarboxylase proenzyme 1 Short=AdoMetDC 1; Short=SAMDC 1; Contains: RecName: Full=S-adenosylmethionine decarboxylase 1 alpha chain; Contains: RecName: Full=S-adenosylmethionine decarboxylase 1 beta chain; Flags: Precursor [Serendipita indica DSM 11827]|nr:S-adenosylmethionine decarboxylase proenzyme 1 Short=AdoMetDC 1; Short=SAMDC 1; Contains: RecName: Full=S-adenosylmethionine decarboxylase 1 alpha chain; Contains: RecName: Full=S-adenosylmethionine decarboxylase 1 beta chain; Flags: Precursor [Serendipita indica DSM 11827]